MHPPIDPVVLVELSTADVYALRRAVLRAGMPHDNVDFPEDSSAGVVHLGARTADGDIVGVSTWIPNTFDGRPAVQLRGMAVATTMQGAGIGGMLVDHGCALCAERGDRLVWARARDVALAFYVRHQFVVVGEGFVDSATRLPHHLILRNV